MFGRKKQEATESVEEVHEERPGAKNRPTPKRRDQEAARKQPLVGAAKTGDKSADKAARRAEMAKRRAGLRAGDPAYLPERDKGPVRAYIRDYVDARRNVAEFVLPVMVVLLGLSLVRNPTVFTVVTVLLYGTVLVAIADTFFMWRRLKGKLVAKYGEDKIPRGSGMYAGVRAFQLRRQRVPGPRVKRGNYPT